MAKNIPPKGLAKNNTIAPMVKAPLTIAPNSLSFLPPPPPGGSSYMESAVVDLSAGAILAAGRLITGLVNRTDEDRGIGAWKALIFAVISRATAATSRQESEDIMGSEYDWSDY